MNDFEGQQNESGLLCEYAAEAERETDTARVFMVSNIPKNYILITKVVRGKKSVAKQNT
jgi:hypothetical protein